MQENPNAAGAGASMAIFSEALNTLDYALAPTQNQQYYADFATQFPILAKHVFSEFPAVISEV